MNPRYELWRRITFGITWLIYATFYFTRQAFDIAKPAFEGSAVSLTRDEMGRVNSVYSTVYMLGQFAFGSLGDKYGPRIVLLFGIALSVFAAIVGGFSLTFWTFIILAVLQGVAQSTGWSNVNKTMSAWFSLRERGRVVGWWCTCYSLGPAIALMFGGAMMRLFSSERTDADGAPQVVEYWPAAFWSAAAVLGVVGVLAWFLLRDRPEDLGLPSIEQYHGEPESLLDDESPAEPAPEGSSAIIREVLSSPSIWLLAISYFCVKLTRYVFIFWGPLYVKESLGSDASTSAFTAAAMPIGGVVGVIAIGYVSDLLFQSRRAPAAMLSLLATAGVLLVGLTQLESAWAMAAFFFCVGAFLFGPDSVISATASMDFGTKRGAGTAIGFVNGVGSIGGIFGGFLPGMLTKGDDWSPLFRVLLIGLVLSACVLSPLWRRKPPAAKTA
ncbi:MFS transporter [Lacipirellula sp.]|uniref:MFS transporter n=1 Tax=Lacipirellula sp. TaxID=2691419 RepID=UPI003D13EB02